MLSTIVSRFSLRSIRKVLRSPALPRVMLALLAAVALACVTAGPASAATTTLWWDAAANPGIWSNSADANWNTSSTSGGSLVPWANGGNGDYPVFSNSGYASASAGTATLTTSIVAYGITFANGSTTIAATPGLGSPLQIIGNIITGGTTTIAGPTTFDSSLGTLAINGNSKWTNESGQSMIVNCALAPSTTASGTTILTLNFTQGNQGSNPYTVVFNGVLSDNGAAKLFLNTAVTSGISTSVPYYTEVTAANTFTGGSQIGGSGEGGFAITNSAALGTGTVNFNGGALEAINNPVTLSNFVILTTSNNWINGAQALTITNSVVSENVFSGSLELGINDSGLVTLAGPVCWNNSNVVGNATKQPTISGSGSITISGNIYNNNAANTAGINWAYNGTGICTVTGTNNQNSGGVILSGAGVLQTSQTGGFGNALDLAGSNAPSTAPANVLTMSAGTLGLLNDLSVTFGTGGTGTANGYTFNQTGNAAIKVDNVTYPGSPPDSTTGQTLTMGSGTMGTNNVLTFGNSHGYSLSLGTLDIMTGSSASAHNVFFNNNMVNGTTSIDAMIATYTGTFANTIAFGGTSPSAVTIVGPITQLSTLNSLGVTSSGSGLVVLTGSNTYNGPTLVTAGTLSLGQIAGVGATLQSTSAVAVSSAAAFAVTPGTTTTSNNSIGGALILNANGNFSMADGYANTFAVGGNGGAATTVLAPSSGLTTNLTFDVGGGTSDVLAISGSAYVGGATASIKVNPIGALSLAGTYDIITAGSGLGSNFTLAGGGVLNYSGSTYYENLSLSSSTVELLQIETGPHAYSTLYYNGQGGSTALNATTSGGNTNFSTDTAGASNALVQPVSVTNLFFSATNLASSNAVSVLSLGQSYNVASLNFTSTSPAVTLTDTSGTNTMTVGGNIASSASNSQTLNVPITLSGAAIVSNSGAGTLTLGGSLTALNALTFAGTGATKVSGAILRLPAMSRSPAVRT